MNRLELLIYNLVKDRPVLKQLIVDIYQNTLALVPQKPIVTSLPYQVRPGFFYGFHDKSPFSSDGRFLLAHRNLVGDRSLRPGDAAEVGFFYGEDWSQFNLLGRTTAWNWQLGSMLQWKGPDHVVFNTLIEGEPRAQVIGLDGSMSAQWPFPVAHVSLDGQYASSYDFLRVEAMMPGYGAVVATPQLDDVRRNPFRIFRTDDARVCFELSLEEAAAIQPHPSMDGSFHFFHHALFNPASKRSFFLHRWVDDSNRRWTRMFSVGVNGEDLYLFPMNEMVSHITWASEHHVFAYARMPGEGDGYFLIEDRTGIYQRYFGSVMNSDGHPTFDLQRRIVLTDTYPDRFRNQYLVLGLADGERRINLACTHLPRRFKRELQVDLHPRLHPSQPVACVDTGHIGTRALMTINFDSVLTL